MKYLITCSMKHFTDAANLADRLRQKGHAIETPYYQTPDEPKSSTKRECIEDHIAKLKISDALIVGNFDDDRGKGYIGTSTFFEIGWAYALGKKIYLLNPLNPESNYTEDINAIGYEMLEANEGEVNG